MSLSHANQIDFSNTTFATDYYYTAVLAADVEGLIDPVELYRIAEQTALESVKSMTEADALELLVSNTRIHTKSDPYYAKIAAQVLYRKIRIEAFGCTGADAAKDNESTSFKLFVEKAVAVGGVTPIVMNIYDLDLLASTIKESNNYLFDYLGLQTLYDRYFLHENEVRYELPQQFFMRVAMGLCLNEDNPTQRAIEAYSEALSVFNYMSSTPTLFNSCTLHPQMSSCYLTTLADDLYEIYGSFRDNAMLSKWAGGIGNDWTPVRALNAHIKGTNGKSQGIVPFLKVNNDTAVAVNQCFDLSTPIYTHTGVIPIGDVKVGDLVLGKSGAYREVLEVKDYDQPETDPMVLVDIKHGEEPLKVTAGHPFLTLRGYSKGGRTPDLNNPTKTSIEWVEAKDLTSDDLVAQVIPQEIVITPGFHNDEALLLGILLGDGHCTQTTNEWGVSGAHLEEEHIVFTINYLRDRGIHYWVNGDESHVQVKWSRNAEKFYFTRDDIYTVDNQKYVNSKFINTNNVLTTLIIKGLLITDGNVSRGKELTFSTGSVHLMRGLRYLLLRNAIPTSVYKREREYNHTGTRVTGEQIKFEGDGIEYVLRIPATGLITNFVDVKPLTKFNWVQYEHFLFSRVKSVTETESSTVVRDLIIEGDESYMLTSGLAHNGGKRKGAIAAYLETFHLDVEEFLELRKNTGDDRRRTHDMNTANWVPDLFMKRMMQGGQWTLFTPNEVPDLHELSGKAFDERYEHYEKNAKALGLMHKTVRARDLWQKMLSMLFETGHPWLTFKDACNIRSPQRHAGVVHSSNLCCIAKDQRVVTDEGLVTIEELYQNQRTPVVSGRGHLAQGSPMMLPRPNAPMVNIHTSEGYTHKVTPDHRVWVVGKGIVEAQHLAKGDKLELQTVSQFGNIDEPELALLTGLLAGDGTYSNNSARIDLWKGKTDYLLEEVIESINNVIQQTTVEIGNRAGYVSNVYFTDGKVSIQSAALARILETESIYRSNKLSIPDFVWKGNKSTVANFLRGIFITDGTVTGSETITTASLSSVDSKFLSDIQILLLNCGIRSSVTLMRGAGVKQMPDGKGGYSDYDCKPIYRLLITNIKGCKLLEELTQLGNYRGNVGYLHNLSKDGYGIKYEATFTYLEELPNEDAYCLTVDSEDHAWTVNGFITHNTEITLNTSKDEVAVCNLGSINIVAHINKDGSINVEKLRKTIRVAVRLLDNVIDINYYPIPQAANSNLRHRPIGLGIMGFNDALYIKKIPYSSDVAVEFADEFQELVSYFAIEASADLAQERGSYESFEGSDWSKGILPLDTLRRLEEERGSEYCDFDYTQRLDWESLRAKVKLGMRNSNVMAIAPTATIANICGVSQSIEPTFQNLYVKSNLSGEFTIINKYLVDALKERGLWSNELSDMLKTLEGDISRIEGMPQDLVDLFATAFQVDPRYLVKAAARRQKWIDQAQSFNMYMNKPNGKKLDAIYKMTWIFGCKTNYYLRALGATTTEKSTNSNTTTQFVLPTTLVDSQKACSILDPDCDACQ